MNQFIEYRREFHKYPENGWREIRTSARVAEILTAMGYTCLMGPDVANVDSIIPLGPPFRSGDPSVQGTRRCAGRESGVRRKDTGSFRCYR